MCVLKLVINGIKILNKFVQCVIYIYTLHSCVTHSTNILRILILFITNFKTHICNFRLSYFQTVLYQMVY